MTSEHDHPDLPLARPLDPRHQLIRQELALGDGYVTSIFHIPPVGQAGAAKLPVLIFHGIQSHPGWFTSSAEHLAEAGHGVYLVTRRGSGDNTLCRGHAPSAGRLMDDVSDAIAYVLRETASPRLSLVGISWGGKLLLAYLAKHRPATVASLTLVAPGCVPRVDVPLGTKLAIGWALLTGSGRMFDIPLNDPELFTANPEMLDFLRRDPLRLRQATARFMIASKILDRVIKAAPAGAVAVPTSLILAEIDRIIDGDATRRVVERLTGGRGKMIQLPGHHTLEFEADPQPFFTALLEAVKETPSKLASDV